MTKDIMINRLIAKSIDFFIAAFVFVIFSYFGAGFLGMLGSVGYILLGDGFFNGQSLGKRLVNLKVVVMKGDELRKCSFAASIIRNAVLIVVLFSSIPIIGWFIFFPLGILVLAIETYFTYSDENGRRIGDVLAGTNVVSSLSDQNSD